MEAYIANVVLACTGSDINYGLLAGMAGLSMAFVQLMHSEHRSVTVHKLAEPAVY